MSVLVWFISLLACVVARTVSDSFDSFKSWIKKIIRYCLSGPRFQLLSRFLRPLHQSINGLLMVRLLQYINFLGSYRYDHKLETDYNQFAVDL